MKIISFKQFNQWIIFAFLLHSNSYEIKFEKVDANILVSQILEENLYELESKGTIIKKEISDISSYIYVNITLFHRLFNNIFSNINNMLT